MQGERFDEAALNDAFARQDALLAKLRESVKAAHAKAAARSSESSFREPAKARREPSSGVSA